MGSTMKRPDITSIKKSAKDMPRRIATLGAALTVLVSAAAGFAGGWIGSEANRDDKLDSSTSRQIISNESELISQIAKDVGPSVVSVNVTAQATQESFFGRVPTPQQSAGTGFIISSEGVIVTNRHVVPEGTDEVSVTLSDGTELTEVEVLGRTNPNESLDIAFLKVKDKKGKDLRAVKLGDSSKMEVGYKVVAIGNALGQFQNTVTEGILSGYGRDVEAADTSGVESLQNLFQTDAAINQGNSGGPLVNANGEVIGVNTAVAGDGAENIGFAIPVNDIKGLVTSVLEQGKLVRPYLGVRYVSLTDDYAVDNQLPAKRGAYIVPGQEGQQPSILPGSPAEKAGLKEGDIITKVNNESIDEKHSLTSLVSGHKVGDEVTLTVLRDGKEQPLKTKLEAAPQN